MAKNFTRMGGKGITLPPQSAEPTDPVEGDVYFSDGTIRPKGTWEYVDGSWSQASGKGSLDDFYVENFEVTKASDFSSGVNATFKTAGGTPTEPADEESSPIAGDRSIKCSTIQLNEWGSLDAIPFEAKQKGNWVGATLYTTYGGTDDDYDIVIWDDVNSEILANFPVKANTVPTRYSVSFYVPTNATNYSWGYHKKTTNAGTLTFDDMAFSLNPFLYKDLSNDTEWEAFTPGDTWSGTGTPSGYWRRDGPNMEVIGQLNLSGDPGAATWSVNLPAGYSMDATVLGISSAPFPIFGHVTFDDSGNKRYLGKFRYGNSTTLTGVYLKEDGAAVSGYTVNGAAPIPIPSSADFIWYKYTVPIEGWAAKAEHVVTPLESIAPVKYHRETTQTIQNNTVTVVKFDVKKNDLDDLYNTSTGIYTAKKRSNVKVNARIRFNPTANWTEGNLAQLFIYKNNTLLVELDFADIQSATNYYMTLKGEYTVDLDRGDYIDIRVSQESGSPLDIGASAITNYLCIESGGKAASLLGIPTAVVGCRYTSNNGQAFSATTATVLKYEDEDYDSHNAYNPSTGRYYFPEKGKYRLSSEMTSSMGLSTGQVVQLNYSINGGTAKQVGNLWGNGATVTHSLMIGDTCDVEEGDYLEVYVWCHIGGSLTPDSYYNIFAIEKIGE